jgi:hypothetical protein
VSADAVPGWAVVLPMLGSIDVAVQAADPVTGAARYLALTHLGIFLLNLLPVTGLDGAYLWRALWWPVAGRAGAARIAAGAGLAVAAIWVVAGIAFAWPMLALGGVLIAVLGIRSWRSIRHGYDPELQLDLSVSGGGWWQGRQAARAARRAAAVERAAADEQAELDRLLAKVSAHGLPSLTPGERRLLAAISRRQRAAEG